MEANLDHYISELLKTHDCVIIPDFGGFVGNYASASINPVNGRFEPPYRKITFNKLLKHNDGLLASFIAQNQAVSFGEAKQELERYTVLLSKELKANRKLTFDRIGVLTQNQDGTFRFEQFKTEKFLEESYGLGAFYGKKIDRKITTTPAVEPKGERKQTVVSPVPSKEPKVIALEDAQKAVKEGSSDRKRPFYWPAAAAVLAIPLIAYVAWLIVGTNAMSGTNTFHTSDLNPFSEKVCPEYTFRNNVIEFADAETEPIEYDWSKAKANNETVEVYSREGKDKTLVVSLEAKVELAKKIQTVLPYHIIGGCFGDLRYANAMVNKYLKRGSTAAIIDKKGALSRVSIASFATKKEAKLALTSYRDEIPNAWILYK
ncbi:MAG: SPOR domain-containing protein [Salibacteraceae bacterium]